jgi:hypothetical protein
LPGRSSELASPTQPIVRRAGTTINGISVATVDCGAYPTLAPGQGNVPQLPWDLLITRNADGSTIASERLTELPRWFVQMGDEPLGISDKPLLGPYVSCPPAVPTPTRGAPTPPAATPTTNPAMNTDADLKYVLAVSLDTIHNQVAVTVGPGGSIAAVSQDLGEYGNAVRVESGTITAF